MNYNQYIFVLFYITKLSLIFLRYVLNYICYLYLFEHLCKNNHKLFRIPRKLLGIYDKENKAIDYA